MRWGFTSASFPFPSFLPSKVWHISTQWLLDFLLCRELGWTISPSALTWPASLQQADSMLLRVDYAVTCETFLVRLSQQLLDMLAVNTDHFMLGGGRNLWFHVYVSHSDLLFCSVLFVLSSSSTPPAWEPNTSPPTNLVQMLAVCIKMKKQKQKNKTHTCSQTKQCANCCAPVLSS